MLKDIFEQAIYSEETTLINWKTNIYGVEYSYMMDNGLFIRITIDTPFVYEKEQLLELIHKDIIHIIKLVIW